jgi:hypothetical protein
MGKSYRIRTTPGDDKNIVLQVDQDFEQLEILSLKIRQQDVYERMCSDYGVLAGRVFSNNGYGIPNAKISVFIPVSNEDSLNPIISSIYPYKTLEDLNEDGFKYNLLPYLPSYPGHVATGTFPSRLDSVIDETAIEIYNKYYRFTVTTNESGDYMIFGVPLGTQTIVMNVDLSDIGPFSLSPQDLIRMGMGTEEQFDGPKFRSSTNFNELPQIIVLNKTIDILPFWGEPETCQIGITRLDYDLSTESNIEIKPTAVFMGSLMSSTERTAMRANGVSKLITGNLCSMIAGPGEIIAITQSIFQDSDGLPILEQAELPNGGKVIDEDGVWLVDLPMNAEYITTNEFGEQVISDDPSIGVPTKGKFRFKIKWQQTKNINEDFKRGYFLVPNVKEKGWDYNNPNIDPLTGSLGNTSFLEAQSSYAFGLDWSAYTTGNVSLSNPDIQSIINCEDYFYEFEYNKVYSISQFIDQDKRRKNKERFLGIKRINDDTCEDTTNKYPANDGVFHTSLTWRITNIILILVFIIMVPFVISYSILAFIINLLFKIVLTFLCWLKELQIFGSKPFKRALRKINCDQDPPLGPLSLPMLSYPDCDICDCKEPDNEDGSSTSTQVKLPPSNIFLEDQGMAGFNGESGDGNSSYVNITDGNISKYFPSLESSDYNNLIDILDGKKFESGPLSTKDLSIPARINAFNTKSNFYNDQGGNNQITLKYGNNPDVYDNTIVFLTLNGDRFTGLTSGSTILTFTDLDDSKDPNITGHTLTNIWGTKSTTGTTTYSNSIPIKYADPNNRLQNITQTISLNWNGDPKIYGLPSDIEYYQILTAYTINDFISLSKPKARFGSLAEIFQGKFYIVKDPITANPSFTYANIKDILNEDLYVVIAQRGVDVYSEKIDTKIGLGRLFGYDNHNQVELNQKVRLNIPIQNTTISGSMVMSNHDEMIDNSSISQGLKLFYPSYVFKPGNFIPFETELLSKYSSLVSPPPNIVNGINLTINNNSVYGVYNGTNDLRANTGNRLFFNPINQEADGEVYFFNSLTNSGYLTYKEFSNQRNTTPNILSENLPVRLNSGSLTIGNIYRILDSPGSSDFTIVGAPNNNVGTTFVATATNPNWGSFPNFGELAAFKNIINFVTPVGSPNVNFIPAGWWNFYVKLDNILTTGIYFIFKIFKYDGVNEIPLNNNPETLFMDVGATKGLLQTEINFTPMSPSDRIIVKVYAANRSKFINSIVKLILQTDEDELGSLCVTSFIRKDAKYDTNESVHGSIYEYRYGDDVKMLAPTYTTFKTKIDNSENIIIRADRLPKLNQGGILQQSSWGDFYLIPGDDPVAANNQIGSPQYNNDNDPEFPDDNKGYESIILNSFSCTGMRDLSCYEKQNGSLTVKPNCKEDKVRNGCYWVVEKPLIGLFGPDGDLNQIFEYGYRFRFYYGLCQGVLSNNFINNWINGNLYAFPFKVNTFYNKFNEVKKRDYPKQLLVLQNESNNFYYRSSPSAIHPITKDYKFIGSAPVSIKQIDFGANNRNLKFPTTIINLGPRDQFLKEVILNDSYYGYIMDQLPDSSYKDLEDIVVFFSASRMTEPKGFKVLLGGSNTLTTLFSRPGKKVDGDFAQAAAVNSQFGVVPFDSSFYRTDNPNPDAVISGNIGSEGIIGIYFDSTNEDIQLRDYVSPMRIIRFKPTPLPSGIFLYNDLPKKTQIVPHYRWNIENGDIFGTQLNNWATKVQDIYQQGYQSLDRENDPYPRGTIFSDWDYRGYYFNYQQPPITITSGSLIIGQNYTMLDYKSPDDFSNVGGSNVDGVSFVATGTTPTNWTNGSILIQGAIYSLNKTTPNPTIGGAPWYFYFGLNRNKTAINKFREKYIETPFADE